MAPTVFKRLFGMSTPPDDPPPASAPQTAIPVPASTSASNALKLHPIDAVVDGYPGPSILLDADMTPIRVGAALTDLGPGLLDAEWGWDLIAWAGDATASAGTANHTSTLATDRGPTMIEWSATLLPDGCRLLLGRDVTLERHLRQALADSRQRFRDMVDMACDFSFETDTHGQLVYISSDGAIGYPADALVGAHFAVLLAHEGMERTAFEARRPVRNERQTLLRIDGSPVTAAVSARPLHDDQGEWAGARGVVLLVDPALLPLPPDGAPGEASPGAEDTPSPSERMDAEPTDPDPAARDAT